MGGKHQNNTRGKRKNGLVNQGRSDQFGGSKQALRNFEQWSLCNKCRRRHLGDCNDPPSCYNCEKPSHLAKNCQNCYNYWKSGHFARDCSKQRKFDQKHSNARVYALTQGEFEAGTFKVVAG